jgi:predicted aspartyl protease
MIDDMGIFRTTIAVEHPKTGERRTVANVIVDTGSEYTWVPRVVLEELGITRDRVGRFRTADGRVIERDLCFTNVYVAGLGAPELVVIGEEGDRTLLGARTLEGLNLQIDLVAKRLVDAGPVSAALAAA